MNWFISTTTSVMISRPAFWQNSEPSKNGAMSFSSVRSRMSFAHVTFTTRAISAEPARNTFVYVFGRSSKYCSVASPTCHIHHAHARIGFKSSVICDARVPITFFMHVNTPNSTTGEVSICNMLLHSLSLTTPTDSTAETKDSE